MDSLEQANRFVNCVMNRYRGDTVMRSGGTLLMIAMPILALFFAFMFFETTGYGSSKTGEFLTMICVMMFFFILSLVMFMVYRRLLDHSERDREWRIALIGYAKSKGFDTEKLEKIDANIRRSESSVAEIPAILLIIIFFLAIVAVGGNPGVLEMNTSNTEYLVILIVLGGVVAFFMMLFVFIYVLKFPYAHESKQIDFTVALCRLAANSNVRMIEMRQTINHKSIILSVILFIITGGLYSLIMMHRTYTDANNHILNQWSYESRLVELIVENERGIGVAEGSYEVNA